MVENSNNENNSNSKSEFIINNATEHQLGYKYKNTINNNRRKTLSREYSNQNNIQKLSLLPVLCVTCFYDFVLKLIHVSHLFYLSVFLFVLT